MWMYINYFWRFSLEAFFLWKIKIFSAQLKFHLVWTIISLLMPVHIFMCMGEAWFNRNKITFLNTYITNMYWRRLILPVKALSIVGEEFAYLCVFFPGIVSLRINQWVCKRKLWLLSRQLKLWRNVQKTLDFHILTQGVSSIRTSWNDDNPTWICTETQKNRKKLW